MDSPGFRGLSAALLIFLLLIYFYNWVFTLYQVYTGEFLGIPQDRHEEERRRHEQQDRNDQSDKDEFSRKENNGRV